MDGPINGQCYFFKSQLSISAGSKVSCHPPFEGKVGGISPLMLEVLFLVLDSLMTLRLEWTPLGHPLAHAE